MWKLTPRSGSNVADSFCIPKLVYPGVYVTEELRETRFLLCRNFYPFCPIVGEAHGNKSRLSQCMEFLEKPEFPLYYICKQGDFFKHPTSGSSTSFVFCFLATYFLKWRFLIFENNFWKFFTVRFGLFQILKQDKRSFKHRPHCETLNSNNDCN